MGKKVWVALLALLLAGLMTGCSILPWTKDKGADEIVEEQADTALSELDEFLSNEDEAEQENSDDSGYTSGPLLCVELGIDGNELGLTDQQRNSFSMLYYLAITAEKIRTSKNNRLMLDDIYTSLLNDVNPGAVDEITQDHLQSLRDIIKAYRDTSIKRERLQYIYNQKKGAAIRSAIPNPIDKILSFDAIKNKDVISEAAKAGSGKSTGWKLIAISVGITAVDSLIAYKNSADAAKMEFLTSGWELDDEEAEIIQNNRDRAFDYMVDIVQEYGLDQKLELGKMTLNEQAIENFAAICAIEAIPQKIRRLESEVETYKWVGDYWLELANCYFETDKYAECLQCIENYNILSTGIYRKDFSYAQILPKAIVAAQNVYEGIEYNTFAERFADDLMKNTSSEDWSSRYFAAEVYWDLYSSTNNKQFLEKAYNITYDNVTVLIDEQRALNDAYLADVKEDKLDKPDLAYASSDEKKQLKKEYKAQSKQLKAYNRAKKEARKTELPPVYEPLMLNCDLLFELADELGISKTEKADIEAVLQTETNGVFLSEPVNTQYSFSHTPVGATFEFTNDGMIIPVTQLSANVRISITVSDGESSTIMDDCVIDKVERKGDSIDEFFAHISSKNLKECKWSADSKVTVRIFNTETGEATVYNFKMKDYKARWWILPDTIEFEAA